MRSTLIGKRRLKLEFDRSPRNHGLLIWSLFIIQGIAMLMDIKCLSEYLKIKPSTLYAWAAKRRIPCLRIHGLIRFRKEEIDLWMESFRSRIGEKTIGALHSRDTRDIDSLIENAKRQVSNSDRGETSSKSALRKEK